MVDAFILVGLPYLAIAVGITGSVWRLRNDRYSASARSSQFMENRALLWGSAPWHIGIILILAGHALALLWPGLWSALLSPPGVLEVVEGTGMALSLLCLAGLGVLLARRITSARVQAVTTTMDLVVAGLLFVQVLLGLLTAVHLRHGAAWSTGTVAPYFWSLITLRPDMSYVADFPALFKLHLAGAWLLLMLLPFTRLIHILSVPIGYLWRAPQIVIWNNPRRRQQAVDAHITAESRREFFKGFAGLTVAAGLLSLGVLEKLFNYFKGPQPDAQAEADLLAKKLRRLQQTAEERELELERQRQKMILVARYSELVENKGHYFIDYQMNPGLAFKGKDGLPIVLSAKCTHLGCTVGSQVDEQGRILCPCHVSYFDIATGNPNPGAPAKSPLPRISWALVDPSGKVLLSRKAGGPLVGQADPAMLAQCALYITKPGSQM